jgi:pimeloyl-ACP methyl ester carboxylesterase
MSRRALFTIAACFSVASSARAQTPVLLVHGFQSNASACDSTKSVLNATGNYNAYAINLTASDHLSSQTSVVSSYLSGTGVADSTIIVGHSQGGLVSRIATRTTGVGGILTIGTPHNGATIVTSGVELVDDLAEVGLDEVTAVTYLRTFCDNHPGNDACEVPGQAAYYSSERLAALDVIVTAWAEFTLNADDLHDMAPGSATIAGLQSGYASEQTGGRRVSVQVDDEEEYTGPFRYLHNADLGSTTSVEAENSASAMATYGFVLEIWGINIETTLDPDDPDVFDEGEMAGTPVRTIREASLPGRHVAPGVELSS